MEMFGNGWKLGFYLMSEGNLTKSLPVWASASLAPWMNTDASICLTTQGAGRQKLGLTHTSQGF